jgi:hypothetical protein
LQCRTAGLIRGKVAVEFTDLGEKSLKNISRIRCSAHLTSRRGERSTVAPFKKSGPHLDSLRTELRVEIV